MDYDEAIAYLYNLKIYGMSLGLDRIEHLSDTLGSPHKNLKAIHVAGTNGKGSVCAMLSSILHSAGYKVGLFTSPHLISFSERIMVNKKQIPQHKVSSLVERIKPIANEMVDSGKFEHPTFFEVASAMAFEHFCNENVDFAVLEVGLGGRLDATNVVTPIASIITTIALDHMHVLGESLGEVAREKAGIIKPGVPVVTGIEDDEVLTIIKKICEERKCEIYPSKEYGSYILRGANPEFQTFDIELEGAGMGYQDLKIPLLGRHQLQNALIAAMAVNVLQKKGISIPEHSERDGFQNTQWPARFEIVQKNPTIILDCAHNPSGMNSLRSTLRELYGGKELTLVMGIMRDKDIEGIISEIAVAADRIIITKPEFDRAAEPRVIENEAKKYCNIVLIKEKVAEAVEYAQRTAVKEGVICVTGSIFNVGEAMKALEAMSERKP